MNKEKKPRKPYCMEYRDKRLDLDAETLNRWELELKHGDKRKMAQVTKLSYSAIKRIFIDKKATAKQIIAIDHYFKFYAKNN